MKRTPLQRGRRLHPGTAAARPATKALLSRAFRQQVLAQGGCVMCAQLTIAQRRALPADTTRLDAHHVVRVQVMKRHGLPPEVIYDPAAGIPVCRFHHATHHAWQHRIPRAVLPAATVDFLGRVGLAAELDREYPDPQLEGETDPEGGVEGHGEAV